MKKNKNKKKPDTWFGQSTCLNHSLTRCKARVHLQIFVSKHTMMCYDQSIMAQALNIVLLMPKVAFGMAGTP